MPGNVCVWRIDADVADDVFTIDSGEFGLQGCNIMKNCKLQLPIIMIYATINVKIATIILGIIVVVIIIVSGVHPVDRAMFVAEALASSSILGTLSLKPKPLHCPSSTPT
jgi:hypothetical protein